MNSRGLMIFAALVWLLARSVDLPMSVTIEGREKRRFQWILNIELNGHRSFG